MNEHVLLIINTLRRGGAERFLATLAQWLAARGLAVTLLVFEDSHDAIACDPRVNLISLHRRSPWHVISVMRGIRRTVRHTMPSVVFSTLFPATALTACALRGLRRRPVHVARECVHWSSMLPRRQWPFFRFVFAFVFARCRTVVCQAHSMLEDLRDTFHVPAAKLTVIHNPVDIARCRCMARENMPHTFFEKKDLPLLVTCAKLASQKDYPTLLRALALLHSQGQPCRLIALGEGPERPRLEKLRAALHLVDYVDFHGAVENPYAFMARADLFVLASHYEGFPNVVIEAMACGAPVVCSDCQSGPREIITHGESGLLVPPGDPAALASALRTLLTDATQRAALARNGAESVARRFDLDSICTQYYRLLFPHGALSKPSHATID